MRWFAIAYNEWSSRRSKSGSASKLAMESLEERSCLAADLSFAIPSTFIELTNDNAQVESHPQDTSGAISRDEFVSDLVHDAVPCQRGEWISDSDWVSDVVSSLEACDYVEPIGTTELPQERHPDETVETGEVDSSAGSDEPTDDGAITQTVGFGFASLGSTEREMGANDLMASGMASSDRETVEPQNAGAGIPSAPPIVPPLPKLESRPMVQPVETLQVPPAMAQPQLDTGYFGLAARQFSGSLPDSDPVKTPASEALDTPLKTEFFVVSQRSLPESPAIARPNIVNVVALMPVPGAEPMRGEANPLKIDENLAAERTEIDESELLDNGLLVKLVTYREVEFSRKNKTEKVKPTEETTDKALNPLCFVVLVGLVGLPQSWRNKVLRSFVARDTRKTPRPISVVPQEDQFEPWRATTFVNREHDETT